ncbi:MAG: transposase, partial [Chlamydiota bacterium]
IIEKAFKEIERFAWTDEELRRYEQELKRARDIRACLLQAKDDGIQQGIQQGRIEAIENFLKEGLITKEQAEKKIQQLKAQKC